MLTQPITDSDAAGGVVRIPVGDAKTLFPVGPCRIDVVVCGETLSASWNPQNGADRERSGRLGVGRSAISRLGIAGQRLAISSNDGVCELNLVPPD